mmetsp:Transcript_116384/g.238093  ORF Transcript_116384/g.238093 Transcript_116384/m.238093 type:complete len:125 (+) Transcript_116384:1140-1514(+)
MKSLEDLDLSYSQLSFIPTEIGLLTTLEHLDLSSNEIFSIPTEIGLIANLEILDLSGNGLSTIPSEIGLMTNLSLLDLSENDITFNGMPDEVKALCAFLCCDIGACSARGRQHMNIFQNILCKR